MVTTLPAQKFPAADVQVVRDALAHLSEDSPVRPVLDALAAALGRGVGAALLEQDKELTPNAAAELLGMSRVHLLTFLNSGALASHYVGSHRRIRMADLTDFAQRREEAAKFVAESRATAAQRTQRMVEKLAPITDDALAELDDL